MSWKSAVIHLQEEKVTLAHLAIFSQLISKSYLDDHTASLCPCIHNEIRPEEFLEMQIVTLSHWKLLRNLFLYYR